METIDKVVRWLREEGYEPKDKTVEHPDTKFFAIVMISEKDGFHVMFPKGRLDSVIIFRIITMDRKYQQAYKALQTIQQNSIATPSINLVSVELSVNKSVNLFVN